MKELKENIKSEILRESTGLSKKELTEVLKFTKNLKNTSRSKLKNRLSTRIKRDLDLLSASGLEHLEAEFKDYKELYPREK